MEFSHHGKLQYSDAASSGDARSTFRIKNWKEVSINFMSLMFFMYRSTMRKSGLKYSGPSIIQTPLVTADSSGVGIIEIVQIN